MPNRIVRQGIIDSDLVDKLSWAGECFYRRLMSVADDFGRFDGRPSVIRSNCYPLRLDKVSNADIVKWMDECSNAGLISVYQVKAKEYLEINKFDQTIRIKKPKFPPPENKLQKNAEKVLFEECTADATQMISACVPESNPIQSGSETRSETGAGEGYARTRDEVYNICFAFLHKHAKKFFPKQVDECKKSVLKLRELNLTDEEFKKRDDAIYERHLGSLFKKHINKMIAWYGKKVIPIKDPEFTIEDWMYKVDQFEKQRA